MTAEDPQATSDLVRELATAFGHFLGTTIDVLPGSTTVAPDGLTATLTSHRGPDRVGVRVEFLAKAFVSQSDEAKRSTWALLFAYLNGRRVAPPNACYLVCKWTPDEGWIAKNWESDEYDEWTDLEFLDEIE